MHTSKHLIYESASCPKLHLYIHTVGMPKTWPMVIKSLTLIGQFIMYLINTYNLPTIRLLGSYIQSPYYKVTKILVSLQFMTKIESLSEGHSLSILP